MNQLVKTIMTHGELEGGIYYPASQQAHPLPKLFAGDEQIGLSFLVEVDGVHFFIEENPGNINGSVFDCYCDINFALSTKTTNKVKFLIKNSQDAIKINFHVLDLHTDNDKDYTHKECLSCIEKSTTNVIPETQRQLREYLEYDDVIKLDNALGLIHELLPEYYDACQMNKIQHTANSMRPTMEL